MEKNFMIDLETLSTEDNAVVLSIGFVKFDIMNGEVLDKTHVLLSLAEQKHRHIEASTVSWWIRQLDTNPTNVSIVLGTQDDMRCGVYEALELINNKIADERQHPDDVFNFWCKDPDFDIRILSNLFEDFGIPSPIRYYQGRSVRTMEMLAKRMGVYEKPITTHNAEQDCIDQSKIVSAVYQKIANQFQE